MQNRGLEENEKKAKKKEDEEEKSLLLIRPRCSGAKKHDLQQKEAETGSLAIVLEQEGTYQVERRKSEVFGHRIHDTIQRRVTSN
jgi:hypothetical protein